MTSELLKLNKVEFLEFNPELIYMLPFKKGTQLPEEYQRWQKTVDTMLQDVNSDKEVYLTLQQSVVNPGEYPRRPGSQVQILSGQPLEKVGCSNPLLGTNKQGNSYVRHFYILTI